MILGKLGTDEAEELQLVDVPWPVIINLEQFLSVGLP